MSEEVIETEQQEEVENEQQEEGVRPEWLQSTFNSVEDQAKAYPDLQKKFSSRIESSIENNPEILEQLGFTKKTNGEEKLTNIPEEPQIKTATLNGSISDVVQSANLDVRDLIDEYSEGGKLSNQSYVNLEKAGISKDMADVFAAGVASRASAQANKITQKQQDMANIVGGQEQLDSILNWASKHLPKEDQSRYRSALDSDGYSFALNDLAKRMNEEVDAPSGGIGGTGKTPRTTIEPFSNMAERRAACRDPRYGKDPEYTKMVDLRSSVQRKQ